MTFNTIHPINIILGSNILEPLCLYKTARYIYKTLDMIYLLSKDLFHKIIQEKKNDN